MEGFIIQPYDVLMLGVLVGLAVLGAWKGVAWQIAALSSLVVSWIVAVRFGKVLAPLISDNEPWNAFIAMLILYLGTSLAIWSFFRLIKGMIDRVQLKDFDRQMGALFGLVKGVLWCLLITFFAVTLSETTRQWVLQSKSGYYTALLIQHGTPALPEDVRNVLGKYIKQLDEGLEEVEPGESMLNTGVSDPRQGSGDLASESDLLQSRTAAALKDDAKSFLDSQAAQLERRIDAGGEQIQGEVREAMHRGFGELDSRIKRLPLEPVNR
jgi:membrane protein required for colicin V production